MGPLTHALSTITSPTFSEVTVFYREYDFHDVAVHRLSKPETQEASWHHWRFEGFRKMHKVRDFRLVLCVDVWGGVGEYCTRRLKQVIAAEKAKSGFDDAYPEPLVLYSPRRSRYIPGFPDPWAWT